MSDSILRFSEPCDKILPAYKKALDDMGSLKKNANNPHFKSKYADLTAVFETADDPLSKHGLFHIEGQGGRVVDGEFYAVIVSRIIHAESGQWVENEMLLPLGKSDPQGAGSAFTYGRRYSLQGLCGLAPEDDDGNKAARPVRSQQPVQRVKIDAAKAVLFAEFEKQLPPEEVAGIVSGIQKTFGSLETGKIADLHDDDEARHAFAALKKAAREFAA